LVLSNTAASFPDFVAEANRLRADLPPDVEATLRRHEADGSTDAPEYAEACMVFYLRHVCRLDPWPEAVTVSMGRIDEDPTVYHTMNGPSEFHVIGTIRDWSSRSRLGGIAVPTFVVSGEYDEATPALQVPLVDGIRANGVDVRQAVLDGCSHMPFWEDRERYTGLVDDWLRQHD
jgi:L-proline amide hydrolase